MLGTLQRLLSLVKIRSLSITQAAFLQEFSSIKIANLTFPRKVPYSPQIIMCEMLPKQNCDLAKKTSVVHFQVKKTMTIMLGQSRAGRNSGGLDYFVKFSWGLYSSNFTGLISNPTKLGLLAKSCSI